MSTRVTRARAPPTVKSSKKTPLSKSKSKDASPNGRPKKKPKTRAQSVESEDEDDAEEQGDAPEESGEESGDSYEASDASSEHGAKDKDLDSDALDDDSEDMDIGNNYHRKRKPSENPAKKTIVVKKKKPAKGAEKGRKRKRGDSDAEVVTDPDENDEDGEENGITIVGEVVQAPKTGRVPPGQISANTFSFLADLAKPECNDREWFKLHDPVFRQAEKEWLDFIENITPAITEMDDEIPPLPPKDVFHRIYRDVRFSNDKTPYKRNFSASLSRSGRKGIFAGYHISIRPGGSILAAGIWAPLKNELATFRANILANPQPLRDVISTPEFVELFGEAKPHPKGQRRNIFGGDDQLKVAPKGIDKKHPDIDLLKLRSVAVIHKFPDEQVLAADFKDEVIRVMSVMRPFVHCLNNLITLPVAEDDPDDDADADADADADVDADAGTGGEEEGGV